MSTQNEAIALMGVRARALWASREKWFPEFTQMSWEQGTALARDVCSCTAFDQLLAEGLIAHGPAGFVLTEAGALIARRQAEGRP